MTVQDKKLIEAIKSAGKLTIRIGEGHDSFDIGLKKDKKLYHDIAIAYQTAVREYERNSRMSEMHLC